MCNYKVGHSFSVVMGYVSYRQRRLALMSNTKHCRPQLNCCHASAYCKVHAICADQHGWDIIGVSNGNMSCGGCMNLTLYSAVMFVSCGVYAYCGVCMRILSQLVYSVASNNHAYDTQDGFARCRSCFIDSDFHQLQTPCAMYFPEALQVQVDKLEDVHAAPLEEKLLLSRPQPGTSSKTPTTMSPAGVKQAVRCFGKKWCWILWYLVIQVAVGTSDKGIVVQTPGFLIQFKEMPEKVDHCQLINYSDCHVLQTSCAMSFLADHCQLYAFDRPQRSSREALWPVNSCTPEQTRDEGISRSLSQVVKSETMRGSPAQRHDRHYAVWDVVDPKRFAAILRNLLISVILVSSGVEPVLRVASHEAVNSHVTADMMVTLFKTRCNDLVHFEEMPEKVDHCQIIKCRDRHMLQTRRAMQFLADHCQLYAFGRPQRSSREGSVASE